MILLQNFVPNLVLGPIGTLLYTIVALILGIIVLRQRQWRSAAEAASSRAQAAEAEMSVHEKTADRLREETKDLREQNSKLKALTDIQPLLQAQQHNNQTILEWRDEGRIRFDDARKALEVNTLALTELVKEVQKNRITSEASYRELTASFIAHTLEDKTAALEAAQMRSRTLMVIEEMERRMSLLAVKVGVHKWEQKI